MNRTPIAVAVVGILLPYVVRLPGGAAWLGQYTDVGVVGFLFFGAFNAIAWGSIVALSFLFRRPGPLLIPCGLGFGFLGWTHYSLDLASDAEAFFAHPASHYRVGADCRERRTEIRVGSPIETP